MEDRPPQTGRMTGDDLPAVKFCKTGNSGSHPEARDALVAMSSSNRMVRQPFSRAVSAVGVKKKSKAAKYPPELDRRVDLRLVKFDVMKPWITNRVTELLGVEDEVLVAMIFNFLEMDQVQSSGAGIHSQLLTFLDVNTDTFMVELWELLARRRRASGIRRSSSTRRGRLKRRRRSRRSSKSDSGRWRRVKKEERQSGGTATTGEGQTGPNRRRTGPGAGTGTTGTGPGAGIEGSDQGAAAAAAAAPGVRQRQDRYERYK